MARDRDEWVSDWEEWCQTYSSQSEPTKMIGSFFWSDPTPRQQVLCLLIGMTIFLPLGLRAVSSFGTLLEVASIKSKPPAEVAKPKALPVSLRKIEATDSKLGVLAERTAKSRFLAVNNQARLCLFRLEADGSIASQPSDVLDLRTIQDPGLDDFHQGSQLVLHPNLNVLYECNLDATMRKILIHSYSIDLEGKLTALGKPFVFNVSSQQFRGGGSGVGVCLDPTGSYLYLTQNARGGATGQTPQIPYFRLNSQGLIEEQELQLRLDLPQDEFYSICLAAGPNGSNDIYASILPSQAVRDRRTAYHCTVLPNGSFEIDSQVQLTETESGRVFQAQGSNRFLRKPADFCWRKWQGLHLDDQGRILKAYEWSTPVQSLVEMMPGYALGLQGFKDKTTVQLFTLDPEDDRPTASAIKIDLARIYELRLTLSDAENHQMFYFTESQGRGLEVIRIALREGQLQAFAPQKLEEYGLLNFNGSSIQIVDVY